MGDDDSDDGIEFTGAYFSPLFLENEQRVKRGERVLKARLQRQNFPAEGSGTHSSGVPEGILAKRKHPPQPTHSNPNGGSSSSQTTSGTRADPIALIESSDDEIEELPAPPAAIHSSKSPSYPPSKRAKLDSNTENTNRSLSPGGDCELSLQTRISIDEEPTLDADDNIPPNIDSDGEYDALEEIIDIWIGNLRVSSSEDYQPIEPVKTDRKAVEDELPIRALLRGAPRAELQKILFDLTNEGLSKVRRKGQGLYRPFRLLDAGSLPGRIRGLQQTGRDYCEDGHLHLYREFNSSGAINAIVQNAPYVAVASNVPKGTLDDVPSLDPTEPTGDPRSENIRGSLIHWRQGIEMKETETGNQNSSFPIGLPTHFRMARRAEQDGNELRRLGAYPHYLSCTDVKFDPTNPRAFVTAGQDGTVRYFQPDENNEVGIRNIHMDQIDFSDAITKKCWDNYDPLDIGALPQKLAFRPGSGILAVTTSIGGRLYLHNCERPGSGYEELVVSAASAKSRYNAEAEWGTEFSRNKLFGYSDACDGQTKGCAVKLFDINDGRKVSETLFAEENMNCQALAVDSTGSRMTVFSTDSRKIMMRTYDLRGSPHRPVSLGTRNPPEMPTHAKRIGKLPYKDFLICTASYSPDNVFIAIARSDNRVEIFDSRFLSEDPIYTCRHGSAPDGFDQYGITTMQWVHHRDRAPNVFFSAGDDGAVRVWDLRKAEEDTGKILIQYETNSIGYFHAGNTYEGERPLIVGDNEGRIREYTERGQIDGVSYRHRIYRNNSNAGIGDINTDPVPTTTAPISPPNDPAPPTPHEPPPS